MKKIETWVITQHDRIVTRFPFLGIKFGKRGGNLALMILLTSAVSSAIFWTIDIYLKGLR